MSSDVHLILPQHVTASRLMRVLARLAGAHCRQVGREGVEWPREAGEAGRLVPLPFDAALPSGPGNPWTVQFEPSPFSQASVDGTHDFAHGWLCFQDATGLRRRWMFFPEHSEWPLEGRLACEESIAINVALAEAVLSFFGGRMLYDHHVPALDMRMDPYQARFPMLRTPLGEEHRHHAFENALWSLAPLTADIIEQAGRMSTHGRTRACHQLACELDAQALRIALRAGLGDGAWAEPTTMARL